jgi:hypothetical protein
MLAEIQFQLIPEHATRALCASLQRAGFPVVAIPNLENALLSGDPLAAAQIFETGIEFLDESIPTEGLREELQTAAELFAIILTQTTVTDDLLCQLADLLVSLGMRSFNFRAPDMAYNLFELSYSVSAFAEQPAFGVAEILMRLADPKRIDQIESAIWRFATERLRESLHQKSQWIEALDAVELALNVPVSHPQHQQHLYRELERVLSAALGSPVEDLAIIVPVQAPSNAIEPARRKKVLTAILSAFGSTNLDAMTPELLIHTASVFSQNMIDDLRLKLSPPPKRNSSLTWHDLTLEHNGLMSVVPLGQSLVVDPERSGSLLLELVHEITHAYSLLGPIGWARQALRVGVTHSERMFVDMTDESVVGIAMPNLPDDPRVPTLARNQLAMAYRAEILEATWTPWLEGVALYLELLCDPKEDPNEILLPFNAVRWLVDYSQDERISNESNESFARRFLEKVAASFEAFYSEVTNRFSRLRHVAYFRTDDEGMIYASGYLLVRMLVARWEQTLGRRIPPIRAAKLLLDSLRNGSFSALPPLDTPTDLFEERCRTKMAQWVNTLGALDRQSLENFLKPLNSDESGFHYSWIGERLIPIAPEDEEQESERRHREEIIPLLDAVFAAMMGESRHGYTKDALAQHRTSFCKLFEIYSNVASLLPVGKDHARVLVTDDGRVTVFPRTYAGILAPNGDLAIPRYSIFSYGLADSEKQVRDIRRACAYAKSARAFMTRIIDLGRDDGGFSYVYMGLGDNWRRISFGYMGPELDEEFGSLAQLICNRLELSVATDNEAATLGSLSFLEERLLRRDVSTQLVVQQLARFSRKECTSRAATELWALALNVSCDHMVTTIQNSRTKQHMNALAHYSFVTGNAQALPGDTIEFKAGTLGSLVAMPTAFSGIRPFGSNA